MKEIVKLGKYLFIICVIAGLALAVTSYFTSKKIAQRKLIAEQEALKEVLPSASNFQAKDIYTEGFDTQNNTVGYILKITAVGYSSEISALIGLDKEFKITGIKILSQNETPGLGTKIIEHSFLSQFIGKFSEEVLLKKDGGKIDAITSATISSRAITNAIREKINEFKKTVK
ncbi:MAG: RnfABCDGE type electron transport complex subunit G [Elusimicrobiota bacterium]